MTFKPGTIQKVPTISNSLPKAIGIDTKIVSRTVAAAQPPVTKIPEDPAQDPGTKEQPPQGFKDPVTGAPTGQIPSQPTIESLTTRPDQATVDGALGLIDQNTRIQILLGEGGPAESPTKGIDTELTPKAEEKPGVDQGFERKPVSVGENPLGSPMTGYKDDAMGGPLVAAAADDPNHRGTGIAGLGIGAVSAEPGADPPKDKEVDVDYTDLAVDAAKFIAKKAWGIGTLAVENAALWLAAKVVKDAINEGQLNYEKKKNEERVDEAERRAEKKWIRAKEAAILEELRKNDAMTANRDKAHIPDPENTGTKVDVISQAILNQLRVANLGKPASKGGGGDIMPTDGDGLGGVVRDGSITTNTSSTNSRNLFGQPGGNAIGENVSGGLKGLDRFGGSNGPGAINPGPDGATPQGDSRFLEDPGKALGNGKPQRSVSHHTNSRDQGGGSQTVTLSGNDGANTLTGSSAAEQLRGRGGDDRLFGMAGDDRIDGGLGRDLLEGGVGRDVLTGGGDADRFRYSVGTSFGKGLADGITDFRSQEGDQLEISRQAFGITPGASATVVTARNDAELTGMLATGNLFVLDQRDGSLLFNQNGSAVGAGNGGVFAILSGVTSLQASDISLIA